MTVQTSSPQTQPDLAALDPASASPAAAPSPNPSPNPAPAPRATRASPSSRSTLRCRVLLGTVVTGAVSVAADDAEPFVALDEEEASRLIAEGILEPA